MSAVIPSAMWPIGRLKPDPKQPRKHRSQDYLERLADNIRKIGVINPIETTPQGMIVTGESRWRAAKLAGLKTVPVRILDDVSLEDVTLRQMSENLLRQEMSAVDTARQFAAKKAEMGWTFAQVAEHFAVPTPQVQNMVKLLGLPEKALDAVSRGQIKWPVAHALMPLQKHDEEQFDWALDEAGKGRIRDVRVAQHCVRYLTSGGKFAKLQAVVKTVPDEGKLYNLLQEGGMVSQLKANLSKGNHIIDICTEAMLALRAVKVTEIAPLQLGRLLLTFYALDEEVKRFSLVAKPLAEMPEKES